jgi:hypothetical protein
MMVPFGAVEIMQTFLGAGTVSWRENFDHLCGYQTASHLWRGHVAHQNVILCDKLPHPRERENFSSRR